MWSLACSQCWWCDGSGTLGTGLRMKPPDCGPWPPASRTSSGRAARQVWEPARGRLSQPKPGVRAARVELRTMAHEARGMYALLVGPSEMYLCRDDMGAWISRRACPSSPVIPACRIIGLCATLERGSNGRQAISNVYQCWFRGPDEGRGCAMHCMTVIWP